MTLRAIKVSKHSYGYVIYVNGSGRGFTNVLGCHHATVAADAAIRAWEDYRNTADRVTVELPPEVEAIIAARGPLPWART
jgi:tRNA threonylcarbamoyladenosine modification (KEOPS) complex Cgi121 subunit